MGQLTCNLYNIFYQFQSTEHLKLFTSKTFKEASSVTPNIGIVVWIYITLIDLFFRKGRQEESRGIYGPPIKYGIIQNDCRGTIIQGQYRTKFRKQPPSDNSIRSCYAKFQKTSSVCILELKTQMRTAIETITADRLQTVWNELDYRVDVCRITKSAHIEHL